MNIQCFSKNISWFLPNHIKDTVGENDQQNVSSGCVTFLSNMEEKKKSKGLSKCPLGHLELTYTGLVLHGLSEIQPGGDQCPDLEPKPGKRPLTLTAGLRKWVADIHVIIRSPLDWSKLHTHPYSTVQIHTQLMLMTHVLLAWSSRWALKISTAMLSL